MKIRILAFGPLRDFIVQAIELDWSEGFTAAQCLLTVEQHLTQKGSVMDPQKRMRLHQILSESVVAQGGAILGMNETLSVQKDVALLPPVCGG